MKLKLFIILTFIISYAHLGTAQEITMFPGFWSTSYYQDENKISCSQVETLMLEDKEANQLWKKSKQHMTIGYVALSAEIGFLIWQLNNASNNKSQTVPFVGLLGSAAVGLGFSLSSSSLKKKAILRYNSSKDIGTLNLGPTYNGLGLVYSF